MSAILSAPALVSRFVPATASLNPQFRSNTVLSTTSRTRVCSCPRSRFLAPKNSDYSNLRAQCSKFDLQSPDIKVRCKAIDELCKAGRVDEVLSELRKMESRANLPIVISNVLTYDKIIVALCEAGRLVDGVGFDKMVEAGTVNVVPNLVTCNRIIVALCEGGRLDDGVGFVKMMEEGGKSVAPNLATYSRIIGELCKAGRVDEGLGFLKKMEERGVAPNEDTYDPILCGLCEAGRVEEALALTRKMEEGGFKLGDAHEFLWKMKRKEVGNTDAADEVEIGFDDENEGGSV